MGRVNHAGVCPSPVSNRGSVRGVLCVKTLAFWESGRARIATLNYRRSHNAPIRFPLTDPGLQESRATLESQKDPPSSCAHRIACPCGSLTLRPQGLIGNDRECRAIVPIASQVRSTCLPLFPGPVLRSNWDNCSTFGVWADGLGGQSRSRRKRKGASPPVLARESMTASRRNGKKEGTGRCHYHLRYHLLQDGAKDRQSRTDS